MLQACHERYFPQLWFTTGDHNAQTVVFWYGNCYLLRKRATLTPGTVNDEPRFAAVLLVLGSLVLARFTFQTLSVIIQTLILPGQNVRWLIFRDNHDQ